MTVQAALQWGLMRWLCRLLFSGAEDVAVQAALQVGAEDVAVQAALQVGAEDVAV